MAKEGEKYVKGLTFNTYGIKQSVNTPSVEHLGKVKLQKNINSNNFANRGNSYSQPKAVQVDNGDIIVVAHNLKDQTLVSWYLKSGENGKFKALAGEKGVTERKLLKFDNPGQLALNGNTMLYSQVRKNIIENPEVRKTNIFKFDVAKVVQDLKNRKEDECLLSKKGCQIDNKALFLSREHEINFLQYVKQTKGNDLVAFLENDQLANKQRLHLTSLVKNGSKSNFTVCEFEDSIKQLYVKDNGQDSFIVTAISEENIAIFNYQRFEKPSKVTIIPASSIKTLSDFVNIINGRLTPGIVSSSTVAPITVAKTVVTSEKASTAMITSTAETDAAKTTKLTTEASTTIVPTSTMSKPSTESTTQTSTVRSTTVEPTTAAKTTVTSQATTITERVTTSTNAPIVTSGTETSTVKPTAATVASTSMMNKPSTELTTQTSTVKSTTVEPTTASKTTVTSQATTITEQVTTSTNVPTTSSEKTTRTVFTIPSTRTKESTTPMFTTTLFPQPTSSPQPTQLAIGSNKAGIIGGSLVGVIGVAGIIGFIAYKYVKGRNAAPALELTNFDYKNRSSSSSDSDEEVFIASNRISNNGSISMRTMHQSETVLNSISVESSSRSRSSSSSSSSV